MTRDASFCCDQLIIISAERSQGAVIFNDNEYYEQFCVVVLLVPHLHKILSSANYNYSSHKSFFERIFQSDKILLCVWEFGGSFFGGSCE